MMYQQLDTKREDDRACNNKELYESTNKETDSK